ncbi:MAG: hypothetical protein LBE08_11540 [Bifidobacteriaceae bacterium]|nr:hypothetical protein [Bifidobacteriaceae bacterium]
MRVCAAIVPLVALMTACAESSPTCSYGDNDSAAVLEDFLTRVAAGDEAGAEALLSPGWHLDEPAFDALTDRLAEVDLGAVRLFPDQLGTMFTYRVMDGRTVVGEFDVPTGGGCAGISWGTYVEPSQGVDPAISPSAAPG